MRTSEIPNILERYGFNLDYILDDKNFPLKERSLPDLCADRIDYAFNADGGAVGNDIVLTAVPEPSTWMLIALGGFAMMGAAATRRRHLARA